ncbi:MAG: hypothetical protein II857_01640 [Selenomonadaceae bacterium]|nr:hypothetical protein [Selenomonadaceae bacterium]
MADKDKIADEMLTDDELDQVAGGTGEETNELRSLFGFKINPLTEREYFRRNEDYVQFWLKNRLNIDATLNYKGGWFTSAGPNSYSRNGESLTHAQVLEEAKKYIERFERI